MNVAARSVVVTKTTVKNLFKTLPCRAIIQQGLISHIQTLGVFTELGTTGNPHAIQKSDVLAHQQLIATIIIIVAV